MSSNQLNKIGAKLAPIEHNSPQNKAFKKTITSSAMRLGNDQLSASFSSSLRAQKMKRMNSNDIPALFERNDEQGFLSQEEIDNLYFTSSCKQEIFFDNLQQPLSKFYTELIKDTLTYMNKKYFLSNNDAKLFISERILAANMNIMKVLGQKMSHQFNEEIFKKFNDLQKAMISYLKAKYHRIGQNFVPADLMNIFKTFDYVESPQNDIVRQAGFYFGKQYSRDLLKMIKQFLNKIIEQVDLNFPRFQKMFQDKVFNIKVGEQKSLNYKISRKLPENTSKFTNINSNSLDIVSPELFRVIFGWVNDMQDFILHPEEEVHEKQTFKVINEQDNQTYYVDQINVQDNQDILKQLIVKLELQKLKYTQDLQGLIKSMYRFQHNMIKILQQGQLIERYVPERDAQIIKFSAYNTKFMSWMLAQKLTVVMKKLIKVGRYFKNTIHMVPLDLIKFNVTDILRANVQGSKNQILQVYNNFKKLQVQEQIKIIKLQNRLMNTQNDILINFKMKDSFLICELQLILSDSNLTSNDKYKNIEVISQFLSQLEKSPYGVISELAQVVGYYDSKVPYENKINFVNKQVGIPRCQLRHPLKIKVKRQQQYEPFICTSCSKYYGRLQNTFIMKYCEQCNNFLCSKCIFNQNSSLQSSYLKEEIISYLNDQISIAIEALNGKSQSIVSAMTGPLIFQKIFSKVIFMKDVKKQLKAKKITKTQFQAYIESTTETRIIYGNFQKGQINLISLNYDPTRKQTSFGYETLEDFYTTKAIGFKDNDFLIFYKTTKVEQIKNVALEALPHISLFQKSMKLKKGIYKYMKVNEVCIQVGFNVQENQKQQQIDGVQASLDQSQKKQFKFATLKDYFQYEGLSNHIKKFIRIQNIGIENSHLKYLKELKQFDKITQLNISKNKIINIDDILSLYPNLERFTASQNFLKELTVKKPMIKLNSLILKKNLIKQVKNFENLPNLQKLNLQFNKLQCFPILKLNKLRSLDLSFNYYLQKFEFVEQSTFPELSYLNLQSSTQNFNEGVHVNSQQSHEDQIMSKKNLTNEIKFIIPYPKLKCFIVSRFRVNSITFKSQILERIQLTDCGISNMKGKFLNLQYFNASYNKFSNLNNLFHGNQNNSIIEIQLNFNQISEIPSGFKSDSLIKLNLSGNKICDITNLSKSSLPNLKSLDISNNQIVNLLKLDLQNLSEFRFEVNWINDIDQLSKSSLPLIQKLDFTGTAGLKRFPALKFKNLKSLILPSFEQCDQNHFSESQLPSLNELIIKTSKIKTFPTFNFPNLHSLQISECKIEDCQTLSNCNLSNLKTINVSTVNYIEYDQNYQQIKLDPTSFKIDLPQVLLKLQEFTMTYSRFSNLQNIVNKSYPNLQKIYLQNTTGIETLPKFNMPNLKTCNLPNNKIKHVKQFFQSLLPKIQEIDLSFNQIDQIGELKFKSLQKLNLSSNALVTIKNFDLPNLLQLNFASNRLEQFPIIGSQKLTRIIFNSNPFKQIQNIKKCYIPNLQELSFERIVLTEGKQQFPKLQMPKLQTLTLTNMNFTVISNIDKLKKLTILSISYCKDIKQFPIIQLPELKNIQLDYSTFQEWKGFQLSCFNNLQGISISFCNIKELKGPQCSNLKNLSLYNNQELVSIQQFFNVNKFTELDYIGIRGNQKLIIKSQINVPNLSLFDMSSGQISSLKLIASSDKLTQLSIAQISLSQLQLKQFKKLITISLVNCKIQNIQSFLKRQWRNLRTIYLHQNKIKQINALTQFPQLQYLLMNNNLIQSIDQLAQNSKLFNLAHLSFNSNKIKQIKSFKNFPKLNVLDLDNNQIQDVSFLNRFENVNPVISNINICHNKIKTVPILKLNTEYLTLTGNKIQSMQFLQKSQLPWLYQLGLSQNEIKKLCSISKLNKLQNLIINDNPISEYEQFLIKGKFPTNFNYLYCSLKASQEKIKQMTQKCQQLYKDLNITLIQYGQRI